MDESKIDELLRLTRENNEMLKKALSYIDETQTDEYMETKLIREFMTNVVANWWADYMRNGATNDQEALTRKDLEELITKITAK